MNEHFASIDLGGTNIHGFIADRTGQIAARGKIPTQSHEGPDGVLERIAELVRQLSDEACMALDHCLPASSSPHPTNATATIIRMVFCMRQSYASRHACSRTDAGSFRDVHQDCQGVAGV